MLSLIAAIAKDGCIGKAGTLPWYLPEDLKRFKKLTTGHVVIMGRKTWESIPENRRPLPNRSNIVITRQTHYALPPGVERFATIEDALSAHADGEIFIIGGGEIFAQTINRADTLHITELDRAIDGCTAFFPPVDKTRWNETSREPHDGFAFVTYERQRQ